MVHTNTQVLHISVCPIRVLGVVSDKVAIFNNASTYNALSDIKLGYFILLLRSYNINSVSSECS